MARANQRGHSERRTAADWALHCCARGNGRPPRWPLFFFFFFVFVFSFFRSFLLATQLGAGNDARERPLRLLWRPEGEQING